MMRSVLLLWALAAVCSGILPEIVDSGLNHVLDGRAWEARVPEVVEEKQLEDEKAKPGDVLLQTNQSVSIPDENLLTHQNLPALDSVDSAPQQEPHNSSEELLSSEIGNNVEGCITDDDCGKESYCYYDTHKSKCHRCKETDVSCSKDEECCGDQLCMWGQCSQNATKGDVGSTCQLQRDCSPDLCCTLHPALLFPVCSAKPIERERCIDTSNHLMELLSWHVQDEGPRKHCPCAGELHCQQLGRGSMCLKKEGPSEEDLTESLYSDIDYIL